MSATVLQAVAPAQTGSSNLSSSWVRDPLASVGQRVPNAAATLIVSAAAGVLIIGLYRLGARLGWHMPMYRKEGFLENLTFFLDSWAALLCWFAAAHTRRSARDLQDRLIVAGFAFCGTLLALVAMEEISWGQQLIAFHTPHAWLAINSQGETTLHNLAGKQALTLAWKVVGTCFLIGVVALIAAAQATGHKVLLRIAPPVTLVPLAALIAYAAVAVHPEIAEVLMSIFFAFYGYRSYVTSYTPRL